MTLDPVLLRGLLVAFVAALLAPLLLTSTRRNRLWILSVPSAAALYGTALSGFLVVSGLGFLAMRMLGATADRTSRWRRTIVTLVVLAAVFTAGQVWRWDRPIMFGTTPVLLCTLNMWLFLRLVTLFWEVGSGRVPTVPAAAYVGWVALPMTLGGPLVRYSELPETIDPCPGVLGTPAWWGDLLQAGGKMLVGVLLSGLPDVIGARWPEARLVRGLVIVFMSGPLGFYFIFAGYFQAMQVLARPAGITIPDSFNAPFGRENISAFWANWNMTATRVFRDYLFYNRWGLRRYNVYANTLVLFGLVGLWHGANAYWVSWGLLHGMMFCVFLAWRRRHASGGTSGAAVAGGVGDIVSRIATYVGVCAAWYLPTKILHWLRVV